MLARSAAFIFIAGVQALEAFLFIRGVKLPGRWTVPVAALFTIFTAPIPYVLWLQSGARQPPEWAAAWIVRPVFAWHFSWLTFLVFWAPVVWLARYASPHLGGDALIAVFKWITLSMAVVWSVLMIWGLHDINLAPSIEEVEVEIPGLAAEDDGLRVVQLSDTHVAWWNARSEFQRVADVAASLNPDLLLVTGDMVDHNPDYVHVFADCLDAVKPRLGRFAVIGNHDVYTGRREVAGRMEERGFTMLRGGCVDLSAKGARLALAGMDDSGKGWTGQDPWDEKVGDALAHCPAGVPVILMLHRPSAFSKLDGTPVALTLAGHTHGGQLRLPFGGPGLADLTFKYSQGLHSMNGRKLYVSRGTGTVGWPVRLFCPAEVTLLVLRSPLK